MCMCVMVLERLLSTSTFLLADVYSEQYVHAVCIFIFVLVFENNSIKQVMHDCGHCKQDRSTSTGAISAVSGIPGWLEVFLTVGGCSE